MGISKDIKKAFITATLLGGAVLTTGCTDAFKGKLVSYGNQSHLQCYSGGKLIFEGVSTGKVTSESSSDGYYFTDAEDGMLKEVSGDCVITTLPKGTEASNIPNISKP